MIFEGKFADITNTYQYYVKIGNSGITREIQEGNDDVYHDGKILCFAGDSPVEISYDMSDTFENVYMRQCTVNLVSNYDLRLYVVASNYADLPIIVRRATFGIDDDLPESSWSIIFDGFVNPLSFNQPFAQEWNEFSLDCTDRLGVLDYIKFPPLLNDNMEYQTPRTYLNLALSQCGFTSINYNIEYDYTDSTKINPQILIGDSEDDWMTCLEVIQEIGKIYGCFVWQDADVCNVENILFVDLSNPHLMVKDDYASDDANISVDEAYNVIKCEVDISNADDDFIDPFDEDHMLPTTSRPERILTEINVKGKDWDHLYSFIAICATAGQQNEQGYAMSDWSFYSQNVLMKEDVSIYDHYCQVLESDLLDFGEHSYLTDGSGTSTSNAKTTLDWLKNHPGKAALLKLASTSNVVNVKNNQVIKLEDLKNTLVIQIGGHGSSTSGESSRLQSQIQNNIPLCSFTLSSSNNITPNDVSSINYLIINGKITLNPVLTKTGIRYPNNGYTWYEGSQNTIRECLDRWSDSGWISPWRSNQSETLYRVTIQTGDDEEYYYQNYTWNNQYEPYAGQYWPYNQSSAINQANMFYPKQNLPYKKYKWQGSFYQKDEPSEIDNISRVPILACELKVGDKYLCEDVDKIKVYNWEQPNKRALLDIYSWHTTAEASRLGLNTYFTLSVDPSIGEFMIGQELSIQNTCGIDLGIKETGFAIPITYDAHLNGAVSFKILGPINTAWDVVGWDRSGILWWREYWTTHNYIPLLGDVENIYVTGLEFKVVPDNGGTEQLNDDNDLVYYSDSNQTYTDDESFGSKFCTALTTEEVNDLGIDYKLNNSAILNLNNEPFYGMDRYEGYVGTGTPYKVKLEEARVAEQYNIWKKPRNIIELSLKVADPHKCNYKQNFTFNYLDGVYRTVSREIDLKQNTMSCKMKDFS